jgi:hypothetical protein
MTWATLIADRYQPLSLAGRGAFAEVWRGEDTATGEPVALKRTRLNRGEDLDGRRREVAIMRALRLPGVVRLRDVGVDGRFEVLVMDWVEGAPFPGEPGPMEWSRLRPLVMSLIETLRGVHALRLRHNDLKPDNVLVDLTTGRVTVLDFNLAAERPTDGGGGTPLTMAPEVIRDGVSTQASDLYSLGIVIAYGLLGGWPPEDYVAAAFSGTLTGPLRLQGVDPEAAAWVEALTQLDPARRRLPEPTDPELDANLSALLARAASLEELFLGHRALHHLPEDAARILGERAGDDPAAQRAELTTWVRRGEARLHAHGVEVPRVTLQRLDEPEALRAALARQERAEVIRVAEDRAMALAEVGRLADACLYLQLALVWRPPEPDVAPAAETLAVYSMAQELPAPIREARLELERLYGEGPLSRLLEAYESALNGELDYAEGLAQSLRPFVSEALEIWRVATLVLVARRRGRGRERLTELGPALAARGPVARAKVQRWWGQEHYLAGEYEQATGLVSGVADVPGLRLDERVAATLQLASATLETGRVEDAERLALDAQALAAAARLPLYEARAVWIAQAAADRVDRLHDTDRALLAAFDHLSVTDLPAWLRLTLAAASARQGRCEEALELARRCVGNLTVQNLPEPQILATAVIGLCGGEPFDAQAFYERLDRLSLRSVRIRVQALAAVACRAEARLRRSVIFELEYLVADLPDPTRRLELFSASEALEIARRGFWVKKLGD